MTRTARWVIVAVTAVFAVTATAWFLARDDEPADDRPVFDLDRLVLTDPPAGVVGDPARGSVERTWSDPATAVPNLIRRWSAQGREPELTQRVDRHRSAAEAEQSRRSDDLAEQIARQLGREAVIADCRLPLSASASAVSCAGTDRAGCKI